MVPSARPSDLYRLPEHARPAEPADTPPSQRPPRRFPAWLGVALVLAAVLVISGVLGTNAAPVPGETPLVDIVSEDQAIAALTLYGAQASAISKLQDRAEIFDNPGPGDAARAAAIGAHQSQQALKGARALPAQDALMQAYAQHRDHATTVQTLTYAEGMAKTLALYASTHDTLFGGTGSIPLDEAHDRINSSLAGGPRYPAVDQWGAALLDLLEERGGQQRALQGRAASQAAWASFVNGLRPAAVEQLRVYVDGLPAATVQGLRGHPVAGPALERLEQQRQASGQ